MQIKQAIVTIPIPERNRQILETRSNRCNEEWQKTLARVKRQWELTGVTPYSWPAS